MKILISKCLLGCNCRYDGKNCLNEKVVALQKDNEVFAICPEVEGGLPTPRQPGERVNDKVMAKNGADVTNEYMKGAQIALDIAKRENIDLAVLKSKSPSCGTGLIYDGTFTGGKIPGNGVTSELLQKNGFKVITEEEL